MPDLKTILAELHYSPEWLEYGLLEGKFWLEQYSKYQTSPDKYTEHYRFAAFQAVLNIRKALDQTALDHYIELAVADIDQSMGQSALALLIKWPGLTHDQLQELDRYPAYSKPFLQKLRKRIMLLRELQSGDVSNESFVHFLNSQDVEVHHALLSISGIKPEQLQSLIDKGANKAIRHIARQKLHSSGKTLPH